MSPPDARSAYLPWAAGAVVLGLLAWQGHHLARWLPQFEHTVASLGPWGPVVFCVSILVLEPLLFPDTPFAVAAGATFGLLAGTVYYFAAVYVMCLGVQWLGAHGLQSRVLRLLETRPKLRAMALSAPNGGVRFAFLVRLLPINQALVSYAFGAVGVPLRSAVPGNLAMFTHMFPTVYFGAAAAHMTRMAGTGHAHWETRGIVLMLGLVLCVAATAMITRRAWAAIGVAERRQARERGST